METEQRAEIPTATLSWTAVGAVLALAGTYWDEAWHTHMGRDSFFSPPHVLLYAGVVVALAAVAWWTWTTVRSGGWRALLADKAPLLATVGAATTLVAGPIDEAWHTSFGRDAVLWSPPHMLGVIGLVALAVGVLAGAARRRDARTWTMLIGAGVLGAALVPVMEYEADAPQFASVWYLPVVVAGGVLAFDLVERATRGVWMVTGVAAVYTVLRLGVLGFLSLLSLSGPFVPPILVPAFVFDRTRTLAPPWRALAVTVGFVVSYAPAMNLLYRGVRLDAADILLGGLLAAGVAWLILATTSEPSVPRPPRRHATAVVSLVALAVLLVPAPAFAHDPGQGELVAPTRLEAALEAEKAHVEATIEHPRCDAIEPVRTVARRAGRSLVGELGTTGACHLEGSVQLDEPGRWFLYIEFVDEHGELAEAWLPATAPEDNRRARVHASKADWAYHPAGSDGPTPSQIIFGIVLYAAAGALLLLAVRTRQAPAIAPDAPERRRENSKGPPQPRAKFRGG